MGIFQKKDAWTKLNEKDFNKLVKSLKEFGQLQRIIGVFHATGTLKAMWNKMSGMGGGTAMYNDKKAYLDMLSSMLLHEIKCVLSGHYHIAKLQLMARRKTFTAEYATKTMAAADYGAKDTDTGLAKASQYIIFTSNSLKKTADAGGAVTRGAITAALENAAQYDPRSEATLRDLHRRIVDQTTLKPTRCMDKGAPYPSTGGAGFLLETTFAMAKGIPLPPHGDAAWFDLACFLLGASIRSHGFTDGNGRIGRAAFATAMLKGGGTFVALKVEAEKLIHGLDSVS